MKRSDLYEYQNFSVGFLKEHPEALLILEMGLGKSAISLTAILDLMFDRFEVGKTLVIAPLRVARIVELTDISGNIVIDSALQEAYKGTTLMNDHMSGDFPVLKPGQNAVSWSGNVTRVIVRPNWRYL